MTVRGRQVTTSGLVLRTMDYREVDRISTVFTEMFGKVPARFIGVNRPLGKLKGLAEPMSFAEFRIYLRDGSDFPIVTGGAIVDVFPPLRASLAGTLRGAAGRRALRPHDTGVEAQPGKIGIGGGNAA